jgi:hypothetical protein
MIKPLEVFDYLGGLCAIASLLLVGFLCLLMLGFGLAAGFGSGDTIGLILWASSIVLTLYLFVGFLRKRRYFNAMILSWVPMVTFFVIVTVKEALAR